MDFRHWQFEHGEELQQFINLWRAQQKFSLGAYEADRTIWKWTASGGYTAMSAISPTQTGLEAMEAAEMQVVLVVGYAEQVLND